MREPPWRLWPRRSAHNSWRTPARLWPPGSQRGRGRSGRAVNARGRMRKRGARGGGTVRRKSPQQGQRPSSPMGAVTSARSQWPRASQSGLMHWTVKPGKYCMSAPISGRQLYSNTGGAVRRQVPWWPESEILGGIVALPMVGVKRKEPLDIVVGLRCGFPSFHSSGCGEGPEKVCGAAGNCGGRDLREREGLALRRTGGRSFRGGRLRVGF